MAVKVALVATKDSCRERDVTLLKDLKSLVLGTLAVKSDGLSSIFADSKLVLLLSIVCIAYSISSLFVADRTVRLAILILAALVAKLKVK